MVKSFDIFDTLIARNTEVPTDIFDIIEQTFPFKDFKKYRILSQTHGSTFEEIYENFERLTGCTFTKELMEHEIQTEIENSYLIMSTYNEISDGDILVSDMYLNKNQLRRILESIGFKKNVEIYVSYDGKATGTIWGKLKTIYDISCHYGDNLHSDINMSHVYGIPSKHVTVSEFTMIERLMYISGFKETAFRLRKFRLQNPNKQNTTQYEIYDDQIQMNIPILLMACYQIRKRNFKKILFCTRDCENLKLVFDALFPGECETKMFQTSRKAYLECDDEYVEYVKSELNGDELIVDFNGTFNSGNTFFNKVGMKNPNVLFIFKSLYGNIEYENVQYVFKFPKEDMFDLWEILNACTYGSLITKRNGKFIRKPCEYNITNVKYMKQVVNEFCNYLKPDHIESSVFDATVFWKKFVCLFSGHSKRVSLYSNFHEEHETLTSIANRLKTDKGDVYKCAHNYTRHYEEILSDLYEKKEHVNILEIGLNRDPDRTDTPSLEMFKEYCGDKATITGFDINSNLVSNSSIKIIYGDQSNINDLEKCKGNYDLIIDDGSHLFSHQQTSMKILWNYLNEGGYYVIEDLHYQPYIENGVEHTREWLIRNYGDGVRFCDSFSSLHGEGAGREAFAVVRKTSCVNEAVRDA